ncbi:Rok-like winged helix domain-containing protein [Priestia endophytica]
MKTEEEKLREKLAQSNEHIIKCILNYLKDTEAIKEKMEQLNIDTDDIPGTLTLNKASKEQLTAYMVAIDFLKSNSREFFDLKAIRKHVLSHVDYKMPSDAYFIAKVQEINPLIQKVRHGCYQYIK